MTAETHRAIRPSILYFGMPDALLTAENDDEAANIAPISSAWVLGQKVVLGLGYASQTERNLAVRPEMVLNVACRTSGNRWSAAPRSPGSIRCRRVGARCTGTNPTSSRRKLHPRRRRSRAPATRR
ncbi:hypothetical protein [Streptomyces sp. NPDC051218]|uniref:hypothetical protein n=1 Tax=Streptomyces sp. NPDC051218 TaxID=3365645 RepID=UPI0037A903FC